MCGIVGFNWEDKSKLASLMSLLDHRGPEQEGFHVGDGISVGHKRLCILDLSEKGTQPLYNEDKTICVSYNGEIYNFKELRSVLEAKGHRFQSNTDTEVLVHGYEEWGTDVLTKVNGQFAFCIFDKNKCRFFLGRDRLGIKPLYYYSDKGQFIFGSELKIFLRSGIDKKIDSEVLDHYMIFGNVPSVKSILKEVQKLPPGHYLVYSLKEKKCLQSCAYWELSFSDNINDDPEEIAIRLREKIKKSVKRRLIADVPLGAFLSGGVDSSIIVAVMSRYVSELKTFSIRFDYPDFNESQYAKLISKKFNTRHFEIDFNAEDVRNLIPKLAYHYDEPFGDSSMIPTYLVCSVAKEHVTVSLSGTGGDELFGGYPRYSEFNMLRRINHFPGLLKHMLDYSINAANIFLRKDKLSKLQSFLCNKEPDYIIYLKLLSYMFRDKSESRYNLDSLSYLGDHFRYGNNLTNLLNSDLKEYLPNCLLTKEDRASMAVSLEVRVPFLDHELVEFANQIPSDLKIRRGKKKYILKKAYEDILPEEILYRRKQGFGVPLVHYFRKELKEFTYNEIFNFDAYDYYDKSLLKQLWDRHQTKRSNYSRIFWSIIMFNMWYKKWMV